MPVSGRAPIFPIPEENHCGGGGGDYGFDGRQKLDLFFRRIVEGARRCGGKRPSSSGGGGSQFKLHRPICKEESNKRGRKRSSKWWWRRALLRCWNWRSSCRAGEEEEGVSSGAAGTGPAGPPLYATESPGSRVMPLRRWRKGRGSSSCGAADVEVSGPYLSLRDLNFVGGDGGVAVPRPVPIYLVT